MNLIQLGYCANLAYVIHSNEFGTTPAIKPCHFGMVYFGMVTIETAVRNKSGGGKF
jgi:hypothetical protein